jgi:hypothetical protein
MNIDINIGTVLLVGFQMLLALLGWFALRSVKGIDDQLQGINKKVDNTNTEIHRLDKDIMALKAELPRDYTRREDFIRTVGGIDVKIDNVLLNQQRLLNINTGAKA